MLRNEVPNNNDIMSVVNIVLNEASNSNDTTHIANNGCLTNMGTSLTRVLNNSHWWLYSYHAEKLSYQRREIMTR